MSNLRTINKSARWETTQRVARTKYVDANPNITPRTRRGRAAAQAEAERKATPFDELVFDSRKHYERSKKMLSRDILHERCINFQGQQDFMEERLGELGWLFMDNNLTPINVTLVREFYSNFSSANQQIVCLCGKQIPITEDAINAFLPVTIPPPSKAEEAYEKNLVRKNIGALDMELVLATIAMPRMKWDSYKPKSGRFDNAILTPQARGL
ncbi:hypothetical protein PIB30_082810 [Stylosanthes scabra]|uniref:Uncharacterized protein n=1 Tax=Stylosanthes scabra TaxID=79078 RepID=A0ABU6RSP7_9FABA|nr:hypothetical protein [Stylosanthes scabra]